MDKIINSFGIKWEIFLAEMVNFSIIIFILYFFVFKKIFATLNERKKIIEDGIENSEKSEQKLKEAEEKSSQMIKQAREQASEKINEAVDNAKEKEGDIISNAKQKEKEILEKAKDQAEKEKENIISSADKEIAKMAILGAEKILSEK